MANSKYESTTEIVALLGGRKVLKREVIEQSELREALRRGLPFSAIEAFVATMKMPIGQVIQVLGIAPRTIARRKDNNNFNPIESDRLYRLARVACMAIQVLGSQEKAKQWLDRPNRALAGETPLGLLDTDIGARQVEAILGRIDHGVFS